MLTSEQGVVPVTEINYTSKCSEQVPVDATRRYGNILLDLYTTSLIVRGEYMAVSGMQLSFRSSQGWQPVPRWAETLFELGFSVGIMADDCMRLVVGLVVPTRLYAAALIATGFVTARTEEIEIDDHFRMLAALDTGTPVYWARDGNLIPAIFSGTDTVDGRHCIWLQTATEGNLREVVWKELAANVHPAPREVRLTRETRRRPLDLNREFLRQWMGNINLDIYATQTRYECVIWGQLARLRDEITQTLFAHGDSSDGSHGTLQDILRVRSFQQSRDPFRTDVLPLNAVGPFVNSHPQLVIFDGARAYLRNREFCDGLHQIVILDRTETAFWDAVGEFNEHYLYRARDVDLSLSELPASVELVAYQEDSHAR
jgi:hypothetical protein